MRFIIWCIKPRKGRWLTWRTVWMIHFKKNSPKYLKRVSSDVNVPFTSLLIATHTIYKETPTPLFSNLHFQSLYWKKAAVRTTLKSLKVRFTKPHTQKQLRKLSLKFNLTLYPLNLTVKDADIPYNSEPKTRADFLQCEYDHLQIIPPSNTVICSTRSSSVQITTI